jgi:PadR family transcriptional regulator PadR
MYGLGMPSDALHEPTFLILAALAGGRKHGYALIAEAETLSDGRVSLRVATLYTALDRLRKKGLVAAAGEEVVDGRLRRYYELTDEGAATLTEEITRMEQLAARATVQLQHRFGFVSVLRVVGGAPA